MNMTKEKIYKVYAIEQGTVIDHLPAGSALKTIKLLSLEKSDLLTVGMNFDSKKYGKKDIIKIQNRYLSQDDVNKLALLASSATINIIKNNKLSEKKKVEVPDVIDNVIRCSNPKCITNNERVLATKFYVTSKNPVVVRCHHCERYMEQEEIKLL